MVVDLSVGIAQIGSGGGDVSVSGAVGKSFHFVAEVLEGYVLYADRAFVMCVDAEIRTECGSRTV